MPHEVAIDSWAFLELATAGPRAAEVTARLSEADAAFTVRDVVVETANFITKVTRDSVAARRWWDALRASRVRIVEHSLDDLHAFMTQHARGALSLTDLSLAHAALVANVKDIATEDHEFHRVKLNPLFAQ